MTMEMRLPAVDEQMFTQFNESRQALAQQFEALIGVVGNQVFGGNIQLNNANILEEINRQSNLREIEKNVLRTIYFYAANLMSAKFILGVLGRFKAGKSTLLNALAQENISPMDTRISTGVLNFTYRSEAEECVVLYDNGQETKIDPADKILYVDFHHNPDNEKGVHSVRHGSPRLELMKEIVFVDTPGLEAVNTIHERITLDFVAQCHAAVIVSGYPPFGEGELRFYERMKGVIPNIFLVQNLPADKLVAWVELEAQTLENLNRLAFYSLNQSQYPGQELRTLLRQIGDRRDEAALTKFKAAHGLHLYSVNALAAYETLLRSKGRELSEAERTTLEQSRFNVFQSALYSFLVDHKGQRLLDSYLDKGSMVLAELIQMIASRKQILEQSIEEIGRQIVAHEQRRKQTQADVVTIIDRTTLKVIEAYKRLKTKIGEQDLAQFVAEMNFSYGESNVFRLTKPQLKEIKAKVGEFNRLFSQRHQEFLDEVQAILTEAQDNVATTLDSHTVFSGLTVTRACPTFTIGDVSGVGYIDFGFDLAYRGLAAYAVGAIAGGSGLALLTPVVGLLGASVAAAPLLAALLGGAIGIGLSFPLEKYLAPVLEVFKLVVGKLVYKPAREIFDKFSLGVREKLNAVESVVVDRLTGSFREQLTRSAEEFLDLFGKTLEDLKEKKSHGQERQEQRKLEDILAQLNTIRQYFDQAKSKPSADAPFLQNMVQGISGFLKRFKTVAAPAKK